MTSGAIVVSGLTKRFGNDTGLGPVQMTVPAGNLTVITGGPDAGKSTLVRCLTGVYRPDAGSVTFRLGGADEIELIGADPRTVAWLRGRHIASFNGPLAAAPRLPAADAVARAARCDHTSALGALTRLRAQRLAPTPVGRLRPAERHTVALAAALIAARPFVLLDEPEAAADPASVAVWVQRAIEGGAAVLATAAPDSALASLATATGELRRGRIEWRKR
ncbi:ATP-binding cassette domain-containing protein [Mycolicibacterium wolinskyi]|uniref:ATP-binding cassette domain-containing protein n=1 Tax=Mycolicibacterium wolinskyi TaxID=59750 RepID=UPI00391782D5